MLVSQPNVHASDLRHPTTGRCLAEKLCEGAAGRGVRGGLNAAEVVGGDISMAELDAYIKSACAEQGKTGRLLVEEHHLDALPAEKGLRSAKLAENGTAPPSEPRPLILL